MLVDDDSTIRTVLASLLQDEGHTVLQAANGAEALDLAARHSPRLIFLDMRMPVMDGWQFAREYRAGPGPHAPIVVMTAAQNAREWCAQVAADHCLPKPFELDLFLEAVQRFVD
jgi:two-component system chemotaxis response regulator CheY